MMRFADPWWLAIAPAAIAVVAWRNRRRARPAVTFSSLEALRGLPRTWAQRVKAVLPWLEAAGLCSLAVAMARPQLGRVDTHVTSQGIAIEMVIDRSGSMRANDLDDDPWDRRDVRRIDVVKKVVADFADAGGELPGRANDLIGLVTFCGYVQTHCPITFDHDAFLRIVKTLELPEIRRLPNGQEDPRDQEIAATALGDGLVVAVERLKEIPAKSRVAILLSDGRGNIGVASPEAAAEAARAEGIKIYTVAIGQRGDQLDETTLQKIADDTHGRFFRARTAKDLSEVYGEIDRLERTELQSFAATQWNDRFLAFLAGGLGLIALHRLLAETRFRSLP